jgi:hypothetical protein
VLGPQVLGQVNHHHGQGDEETDGDETGQHA